MAFKRRRPSDVVRSRKPGKWFPLITFAVILVVILVIAAMGYFFMLE